MQTIPTTQITPAIATAQATAQMQIMQERTPATNQTLQKIANNLLNTKKDVDFSTSFFREASGIRTPDNLIKSQVLYRLS